MDDLHFPLQRDSPLEPGERDLFVSKPVRHAIAEVALLVRGRTAFGVLVNHGGCGMTRLLRHLSVIRGFGDCATEFVLTLGPIDRESAINVLARGMSIARESNIESAVIPALQQSARQSIRTIWLIDESAQVDPADAQALASRFDSLTVLMAVHAAAAKQVGWQHRIELRPLSRQQTREFIRQILQLNGHAHQPLPLKAIQQIHQQSGGRIKTICRLVEQRLAAAASAQLQHRARAA